MPRPVVCFVLAFGAGLVAGLVRFPVLPVAVGCLATAMLLRRSDAVTYPIGLGLGLLHGGLATAAVNQSCATALPRGPLGLMVRLLENGRSGLVQSRPLELDCRGVITLRWPDATPRAAGSVVTVTGRWITRGNGPPDRDGLLVVRDVGPGSGRPRGAPALRGWVTATAERLFGTRAPMVEALVLGRRGGIAPELRDAFTRSGLVHLLSISGFHVGLLATWLYLTLRMLRLGREPAMVIAAGTSVAYVAFLGWPAPAARAATLGVLLAAGVLRQRRVEPTSLLAASCLGVLLVDPWSVVDLGGWLSAAALWGATTFSRWGEHALGPHRARRMFFASIGATLATAPLTAAAFGTVAIAGIALNFLAIPLAAVAVPGVLLSLLVAPLAPAVAEALAGGTGLALAGVEALAWLGARIPGGALVAEAGPGAALPWLAVLGVACWIAGDWNPPRQAIRRAAWGLAAGLWIALVVGQVSGLGSATPGLTLHFLNVGQGDAAVLRTPGGHWVVVDAGPVDRRGDAGSRVVAPFLIRAGARSVSVLVASHAHADHLGGVGAVLDRMVVETVLEPAVPVADSLYLGFLDRVDAEGSRWVPARASGRWMLDSVSFRVLHPDTTWPRWGEDLNEDSVVLLVEYRRFRVLFTGDAGLPVEARLRGQVGSVDLLKAGHHGSRTATGVEWLEELAPRAAVISVGQNRYGHPSAVTLRRLAEAGVPVWRTDREGTVSVWTDGYAVRLRGRDRDEHYQIPQRRREPPAGFRRMW